MSWRDFGIEDPGLRWDNFGLYQELNSNKLGQLFDKTSEEIEDFQLSLYEMMDMGIYENQISDLLDWIHCIEDILFETTEKADFRNELINVRIKLSKFKKYFDKFAIQIDWFGE